MDGEDSEDLADNETNTDPIFRHSAPVFGDGKDEWWRSESRGTLLSVCRRVLLSHPPSYICTPPPGFMCVSFPQGMWTCERVFASLRRLLAPSILRASQEISARFRATDQTSARARSRREALTAGGTVSWNGRPVAPSGVFDLTTSDFPIQRVPQLRLLPFGCFSRVKRTGRQKVVALVSEWCRKETGRKQAGNGNFLNLNNAKESQIQL